MTEWRTRTLGDLTVNFDAQRRPVKSTERIRGETPYFGASGVIDFIEGHTHEGEFLLVAEDGENLRSRRTPIAFMANGRIWVNNHAHIVQGAPEIADTRFLMHAMSLTDIAGYLTGSTQPKLTRAAMDSILLRVPSFLEQRNIAEVLGALDDKIAANTRLAATAADLMIAWAHSGDGLCTLGEVASRAKKSINPEGLGAAQVDHFSLPAHDDGQSPEVVPADSIKSNKYAIEQSSVLLSKLNPRIPRIWDVVELSGRPSLSSTEFIVLHSDQASSSVLWAVLSHPNFLSEMKGMVAGTSGSHQRVRPEDVMGLEIIDPRSLSSNTHGAITALGRTIAHVRSENASLSKTRDSLLPLLMSGRVTVKDAESVVEEAV